MADHSAETFARLEAMAKELQVVEARNNKIHKISYPLIVNGEAYADLWIPSFHQKEVLKGVAPDERCEAQIESAVGLTWECTMFEGHRGYSHVACYMEVEQESRQDQVLEIWNDERSKVLARQTLWIYDSTGKRDMRVPRVYLPNITKIFLGSQSVCAEEETFTGHSWICTLPEGHVYSHVAAASDQTLAFWPRSD